MEDYKSRKIKFKAWNSESKLLMRLNSIECRKGELVKKDHILLQFTGLVDKDGEEIYDMDIMLVDYDKFIIFWNEDRNGWYYSPLLKRDKMESFVAGVPEKMRRFCNFFELQEK
jgi:YopX protein